MDKQHRSKPLTYNQLHDMITIDIPLKLFSDNKYKDIKPFSKVLYAYFNQILQFELDFEFSNFLKTDENNEFYMVFNKENLIKMFNIPKFEFYKALFELAAFGLIKLGAEDGGIRIYM